MGMSDQTWDESLLRSLAVLQIQCRLLDEQADILTDLSDMQAHRRIKSDLADYIAAHAKAGTIPSDPLAEIETRLRKVSNFFSKAEETRQRFLVKEIPARSLDKIRQAQNQLEETANQLPARLQSIAAELSPLDWEGDDLNADIYSELVSCAQGMNQLPARLQSIAAGFSPLVLEADDLIADIYSELVSCAQGMKIDLPETAELRRNFRLLALGKGHFYQGLQFQFQKVRESLLHLVEIHARHRETLTRIAEPILLGNHRTAGQIMVNGGIDPNFPGSFIDLDYSPAKKTAELQIAANTAVSFASGLSGECNKLLKGFEKVAGTGEQSARLANAKRQLLSWRNFLDEHWAKTTGLAGSELEQECRPHLEAAYQWLDWAETELNTKATKGTEKRFLKIFAITAASLLVVIAITIGISAKIKHNKRVAAAEKLAAEKAAVEQVAAEKAATEKAAADQAAAEKAAAEKAAADQAAAENAAKRAAIERAAAEKYAAIQAAANQAAADLADAETECKNNYQAYLDAKQKYDDSSERKTVALGYGDNLGEYQRRELQELTDNLASAYKTYLQSFEKVKRLRAGMEQTQTTNK
jgi:hypothetical protein